MVNHCFAFLKSKFSDLEERCKNMEIAVVEDHPREAIMDGGLIVEDITKLISDYASLGYLNELTQYERLNTLGKYNVIPFSDQRSFDRARKIRNNAAHNSNGAKMENAYTMHRLVFNVVTWFYKNYGDDSSFIPSNYNGPIYVKEDTIGKSELEEVIKSLIKNNSSSDDSNSKTITSTISNSVDENKLHELESNEINEGNSTLNFFEEKEDLNLVNEYSFNEIKGSFLLGELSKLKDSSKEAVEDSNQLNDFKKYLHVERSIQKEFLNKLEEVAKLNSSHLVMLCGSVGDGKSHLLAYLNTEYPELAKNFKIHNDATESFDPNKNAIDTLATVLNDFKDDNFENSNEKLILAINLGVLNNFMESDYASKEYTKLKNILVDSNIFDSNDLSQNYDDGPVSIISFSDSNIFELHDPTSSQPVGSEYISSLLDKIVFNSEKNPFYKSYIEDKNNGYMGPIIYNYEMLMDESVKEVIINLIIKIVIKYKKIISTRDLLNFIYEIIVPSKIITYDGSYNILDYFDQLLPNLLFANKNSSDLLMLCNKEDPINVRSELLDNLIIDLNINENMFEVIEKYIDCSSIPFFKENFEDYGSLSDSLAEKQNIIHVLIRFAYVFGKENVKKMFANEHYSAYLNYLYFYNLQNYSKYQNLFNQVKMAIFKWKGFIKSNFIILDNLNNFNVGKKLKLNPAKNKGFNNLMRVSSEDSFSSKNRFKTNILISFKVNGNSEPVSLNIDYPLYISIVELNKGFKPNKHERKNLIVFEEFIDELINKTNDVDELLIKYKSSDDLFSFSYDDMFDQFSFSGEN